jgi:hypothetical protein
MSIRTLILMLASASGSLLAMESLDDQLLRAAGQGNYFMVQALLNQGANVNAKEANVGPNLGQTGGQTPLMLASENGHENIVSLLIKNGADLNARDLSGYTALEVATWQDNISICKLLLNAGANVNITNRLGRTALWRGNAPLLNLLLTHIPLADQERIRNSFAVNYAMKANKQSRDIRQLISTTQFDMLVQEQMQRIAQLLAHKDKDGKTVRDWAAQWHPEIAKLLDLNNPASYELIRKQVANNVRRVIHGE